MSSELNIKETEFWNLIEKAKKISNGNYSEQCVIMEDILMSEKVDIPKFNNSFWHYMNDAYDWKVWAAAYIINGGCSDDCFIDFRSWLIAQGKEVFYLALSNPEKLSELDIQPDDWEGFQYVAENAYLKKTGMHLMSDNLKIKKEPSGDRWEEEDLQNLFPILYEKYSSY